MAFRRAVGLAVRRRQKNRGNRDGLAGSKPTAYRPSTPRSSPRTRSTTIPSRARFGLLRRPRGPASDVRGMAYMIHLPAAKWGRGLPRNAALIRGALRQSPVLLTARSPRVSASRRIGGGLEIEVSSPPASSALPASGASLPAIRAGNSHLADYQSVAPVAERRPVSEAFLRGRENGSAPWPRDWAGEVGSAISRRHPRGAIRSMARDDLGPSRAVCSGVMNRGGWSTTRSSAPWIHVGSRMQLLSAGEKAADELTARGG